MVARVDLAGFHIAGMKTLNQCQAQKEITRLEISKMNQNMRRINGKMTEKMNNSTGTVNGTDHFACITIALGELETNPHLHSSLDYNYDNASQSPKGKKHQNNSGLAREMER